MKEQENLYSLESEMAVLGSMIVSENENCINYGLTYLKANDFYDENNRIIFNVINNLKGKNINIDALMVNDELQNSGIRTIYSHISKCIEYSSASYFKDYCGKIRNYSVRRSVKSACFELQEKAQEISDLVELSNEADRLIFKALNREDTLKYSTMKESIKECSDRFQKIINGYQGLKTYYKEIDDKIIWFEEGDLVVIAGRASMSKSMTALSIAKRQAKNNNPVGIFSIEMTKRQIVNRWIADECEIDYYIIRREPGKIDLLTGQKMQKVCEMLEGLPIWIDDTAGIDFETLKTKIKTMKRKHNIRVVYIDHLTLITTREKHQNEHIKFGVFTSGLKALAKELQITIVLLSQINRGVENRSDKHPFISDLAECGKIEQDADIIMLLYRDEYYNKKTAKPNILEVWIGKGRECATGAVELHINTNICRISDM